MHAHSIDGLTQHRPAVRAFVLRLTHDAALADDIAQETFVRAQQTSKPYRGDAGAKSWLCAIALNLVRDHFRALQRCPQTTTAPAVVNAVRSPGEDAEAALLKREMSACIAEHLLRLPHPQYDVVALHDMAGLSHAEIAAQLGISTANARVILHRGRAALQKILEDNCRLSFGEDEIPCERLSASGRNME